MFMPLRALAFAAAASVVLTAHARDFRSSDVHPTDYPTVEAVRQMGKQLSEQTKGKLGVKVFPAGALGSEKDTIEQLKIGGLDMMRINAAPLNNIIPETIAVALPFVFRSVDHMRTVVDGPIGDDILAAMASQGMIGLTFYDSGARSFYTTKKPIKTMADLKGMKIRVQQSDVFVAMIEALGANATPMPFGEVYTALKTGIVDGAENNWPSYESTRHFEAAKYYDMTEHSMVPEVLVFSKRIWDKLSKEDQTTIRKAAKDSVPYMRKLWDEREQKSRKIVEAAGAQVVPIPNKQEFIDAMKPVYAKFANTPKLQELVKRIQDTK
jgi:tripartite ATP-independent transporter DctP family solute receptor